MKTENRKFVCFLHIIPYVINFGISFDFLHPNIEIHLPFSFIRIGWQGIDDGIKFRTFGKDYKY